MKKLVIAAVALVVVLIAFASSFAVAGGERHFKAKLNGYQEVPAISSTGHGSFRATLNASGTSLSYTLTYADLEGTVLFAHIHFGQRSVNGGVAAFLCGGGGKPDCPAPSGTVSGTVTPTDVIGPSGQGIAAGEFTELLRAMRSGVSYANVHTTKHPGGEIRGQIKDHDSDGD